MSKIDLVINSTPPLPPSGTAQYARIDNTSNPVFSPSQTFTAVPYNLTPNGVDNGQYQIVVTPTYLDGRTCQAQTQTTAACPNMISVNAVQNGNNIVINYVAPSSGPNGQQISTVAISITGPNGSSFNSQFTNGTNNSQIIYAIPPGNFGNYVITMQVVCDTVTGFLGTPSPAITVTVPAPITNPSLSGQLVIICGTNCGASQNGALQFNLSQPLSNDLVVQMAYELHNTSGSGSYSQYGCNIIPAAYIRGNCNYPGYATFTIPAGVLSFTTPNLFFNAGPGGGLPVGLTCFCPTDAGYTVFVVDRIFLHAPANPSLTITLTPADNRLTVIQV